MKPLIDLGLLRRTCFGDKQRTRHSIQIIIDRFQRDIQSMPGLIHARNFDEIFGKMYILKIYAESIRFNEAKKCITRMEQILCRQPGKVKKVEELFNQLNHSWQIAHELLLKETR